MNKYLLLSLILPGLSFGQLTAQSAPPYFQYQAVARDGSGVLAGKTIGIQATILKNSMNGVEVYKEEHNAVPTNEFGLFSLKIGGGNAIIGTSLSAIDWGTDMYWLRIGFKPPGGNDFLLLNATQLLSVPYALYAEKAGNANDSDPDPANELQTLTQNGLNVTLSHGGGTFSVADNDNDPTNEIQIISKAGSTVSLSKNGGSFTDEVNDADASPTNELQTLSLSGNNLSISNGNSVSLAGIGSQWLNNPTGIHYSGGRVGIRTAAPQGQLEIINDQELTTGLVVTKTIGNEPIALFRADFGNSGSSASITRDGILNLNRFFSPATNSTFLRFYRANSPKARIGLNAQDELSLLTGDTETPALIVDATGRIGIGTDDPTAGLSVVRGDDAPALAVTKTAGTQPIAVFNRDPNPGSEAMIITRPGSIGIGLPNPDDRLHLHNGIFRISQPDFGPQSGLYMRFYKGGTEYSRIGLNQNNGLAFFKGATDEPALNVNSNGNVGIGSDSPDATLQVNGTVSVFGNWEDRSPGTAYQAPTDGFVVVRLTVTGNNKIRAEGFTSTDDSFTESEIRAGATAWSNADVNSFTLPVAKGEYWKVDITAQDPAGTNIWVRWRPLGLGN